MRYPQTFIDDLKRQADIVRVIQDYVQLKKKGANWMACCPFHKEKTPSFSVSPAKEIFYCFGCHKGGSVFNFVMEIERVNFPEAIKIVADKIGMPFRGILWGGGGAHVPVSSNFCAAARASLVTVAPEIMRAISS